MIKISEAKFEETKDFVKSEWPDVDEELYGIRDWVEKDFLFKADENGVVVGSIMGKYAAGVLYIDDLIVAKTQRGKGIGKMLMVKAEEWGKTMGAHKSYLITKKEGNKSARKFYDNLGYSATGEFKNHYYHFDFVIYEKSL